MQDSKNRVLGLCGMKSKRERNDVEANRTRLHCGFLSQTSGVALVCAPQSQTQVNPQNGHPGPFALQAVIWESISGIPDSSGGLENPISKPIFTIFPHFFPFWGSRNAFFGGPPARRR